MKKTCAVIGGGPMGLMAAYMLAKSGVDVTLFESDNRLGGMSASFDFGGIQIERYYHFVCKPDNALFSLLSELGLSEKLKWKKTKMSFFFKGKLYKWGTPFALLNFPEISIVDKIRYALHIMYTKNISDWTKLDKIEAHRWIKKWVGQKAFDVLWKPLFYYKFYEFAEFPSAAWIGTRIKRVALSRKDLFNEELGYLEGGSEIVINALEQEIFKNGGKIRLNSPISKIILTDNKISGVQINGAYEEFDSVVSTIPLPYLTKIIPDLPESELKKIKAINNVAVACVVLKLKENFSDNFWMNINHQGIEIPGIIEYTNLNHNLGTAERQHIVYAPYYMPKNHPKYGRENVEFVAELIAAMKIIKPDFSTDSVLASHVHKYEFSQTVCPVNFYEKLPPMKSVIKGLYYADTSYHYPEDRSICESVMVGTKLAEAVMA